MNPSDLDNLKKIYKLDTGQVAKTIELLPSQLRQVLEESRLIKIPHDYSKATRVVINGMGGSSLGAYIIKSALSDQLKAPIDVISGYEVPAYVDKHTIYVISSYSGNTEEPVGTYREAKKRGAKILAITEYGPKSFLGKLMLKDNIPGYIFKPENNPANQPRLGVGYSVFGIMTMLAKAGLFTIKVREIENTIASMEIWSRELRPEENTKINLAKKMALNIHGKIPVLVSGGFLAGNLHAMRNQINECAKLFSAYLVLPDLNHYAMEGLVNPTSNKKNLAFVFFDSNLYHPRVQKRAELTKEVVKKNGVKIFSHTLRGDSKITQAFELLQFGSWVSYYLGILNNVNPVKIPWVDWFKKELEK
jgi:glucose/mannose-6-phosphate isomerase